jgi:hypothetical protein
MALQMVVEAWLEVMQCLVQTECVTGESIASETGCRYILLSLYIMHRCIEATHGAGTVMRGVGPRTHGVSMEVS